MKVRAVVIGLLVSSFIGAGGYLISQEPGQASKAGFMRMKLEPAKNILEGIALANFDTIRKNTEQIRKLTLDEGWMVRQTEEYRAQSKEFQRTLNLINRGAEEKDLDAVTLAYMQMTLRCVQCHKTLRDVAKP